MECTNKDKHENYRDQMKPSESTGTKTRKYKCQ